MNIEDWGRYWLVRWPCGAWEFVDKFVAPLRGLP